jgi:membrane protein
MFATFDIPLSWGELLKRTVKEAGDDDCLGLAAQLAYYFFLALFPAVLFIIALASFFPLTNFINDIVTALRPIAPGEVLTLLEDQLRRISDTDSGGILTLGILGAIWSSSAAVVAIMGSLNRAYDIEEGRPWWKVRLTAIGLTIALALLLVISFTLIVVGPAIAAKLASQLHLGAAFQWTWTIVQWPVAFALVATAVGLVYYFAPDAEQDWAWITPGAVLGTLLWVLVSLGFKFYASHFADYNATYGTIGGVIVLMLWFYISGLAILLGAEMNAEIEHASPWGKDPGEKVPGQRKKIGAAAGRAYQERLKQRLNAPARPALVPRPAAALQASDRRGSNMAMKTDEQTLGEMFAELSRETRTLIQQEVQLAKTELSEKASIVGKAAGLVAGGGLIAYGGLLAVIAAVVLVLIAFGLPPWAGALLGGVLAAAIGYLLIRSGVAALKPEHLTPTKTIETLKEDAQWLKAQAR